MRSEFDNFMIGLFCFISGAILAAVIWGCATQFTIRRQSCINETVALADYNGWNAVRWNADNETCEIQIKAETGSYWIPVEEFVTAK